MLTGGLYLVCPPLKETLTVTKLTIVPSTTAFSLQKLTAHTLPGPSCPEADKTHASPSLVMAQPGERLVPTSHTLQTPGRGGEVRLDTQTDLLVCILGPLTYRQRKARTEDPCIRSAELDLSVAG